MSTKMGRPRSSNPMCIDLKVRVNKQTNEILLTYCEAHGISKAEAIRRAIHQLLEK
ncbi:MAG: ribbon-helix-helix protein, CopG family [Eubacterium sp.]|nr:ribbon-helix-helix protein, CopG family [Eubacterium sp.]